ncbi:MAG: class I SAM-dependent methyltransferase [Thermoleophilia bacterium]|nr:class I SAM-dependent methyltransferase [Thermoleophilia bacterium]
MKRLHERYVELVRTGPSGLFSRGDLDRLDAHVEDGIVGAPLLAERGVRSLVDVGSGGGIPAIPLAVELADTTVHLVESQRWKAEFLLTCARALDLESRVRVHPCRAEEAVTAIGRELCDAGTARALAAPIVVAEYLAPLVRVGGLLLLWVTAAQAELPQVAANELLGLGAPVLHPAPTRLRSDGVLLEWPKVAECAPRIPRRVGVAARRPLA